MHTQLHWLDIEARIKFKQCVLTYRCLHGLAPDYLTEMLSTVSSSSGRAHLRSAAAGNLIIPTWSLATYGPRSFLIASPSEWNSLPVALKTDVMTLATFRKKLKSSLFVI